ncbi:50S ribosomal protein L25/general stress protein Ctc [Bacillus licheniformis]|uniref:Large ribosomal subunit protein bL25 n=1 Tax=Bacillus cabrialesii subsp. tritici TaxID=2944916 RepID=A0ABT9DFJ1_9BACI|nr:MULTISPECIES: 50S ribosomal protein L25/general stress protein Ctc [Bacillus]OBA08346.1 50S ribosomal protein L25/general stress protein Ctc [Bacillus subtilis]OLQ52257.1 50S ribosomal protein L25/general stress protein Ctc [Bacillus licheniformis]MBU2661728.1 50S ribosomal protein L25/general stress protein Ctc [Bacillus cabrialesii]MDO8223371.1 50S ribosomal protein L25/general stress protein Ctc [Bacillus cabrialesii subsp. tritici]RJS55247.1 50S ribosomal protein L25 [Bacillus subtilis]
MATLTAKERTDFTRSSLRNIRTSGHVPGIIYGKDTENKPVSLDSVELIKTLRDEGKNTVLTLDVGGKQHSVMVTDLQTDPLKNEITHADFQVVNMSEDIEVEVPIHLTGEAIGVKNGGVLQQPLYELTVKAKPKAIPQSIEADISKLDVNEVLTIADLPAGGDYSFNHESDEVVASILPPQQQEAAEIDEEESADAQPEGENKEQ